MRKNTSAVIAVILVIVIILAGIMLSPREEDVEKPTEPALANWTTFFYLDGDNNLGEDDIQMMLTNLYFLEQVGSIEESHLVALLDRAENGDSQVFYIEHGNRTDISLTKVNASWTDEVNMGDPGTLTSFVSWGIDRYPATHYCVHLSDHGGGWRGMCWDDTSDGDHLSLPDIKASMEIIKLKIGRNVEILSTEGCLVGMIEFAYQLRDVVDYFVGGETYGIAGWNNSGTHEPGNWQYDLVWGDLAKNSNMTPEEFTEVMIDNFNSIGPWVYPPMIPKVEYSDVMASFNLSKIAELGRAVDNLSLALIEKVTGPGQTGAERNLINGVIGHPEYQNPELYTESFSGMMDWVGSSTYTNYDLYDFAYQLTQATALRLSEGANPAEIMRLVDEVIVKETHGEDNTQKQHVDAHGIAIYIPYRSSEYNAEYEKIDFAQDTNWDEFLKGVTWA